MILTIKFKTANYTFTDCPDVHDKIVIDCSGLVTTVFKYTKYSTVVNNISIDPCEIEYFITHNLPRQNFLQFMRTFKHCIGFQPVFVEGKYVPELAYSSEKELISRVKPDVYIGGVHTAIMKIVGEPVPEHLQPHLEYISRESSPHFSMEDLAVFDSLGLLDVVKMENVIFSGDQILKYDVVGILTSGVLKPRTFTYVPIDLGSKFFTPSMYKLHEMYIRLSNSSRSDIDVAMVFLRDHGMIKN